MAAYDDIASRLPIQQLAQQVGADPAEVERAVHTVLPALLGGLQANAADPGGAAALTDALGHHQNGLADGTVDLHQVDTTDGAKITQHVFGAQTQQVIDQLGGVGGGSGLVAKLMPMLAPIVMSYVAQQMKQGGSGSGGGALGSILGSILGGAGGGSTGSSTSSGGLGGALSGGLGGELGSILGGLLGGGTKK